MVGLNAKIVYPSAIIQSGGASFTFTYPRRFPAFQLKRIGKDSLSGAGLQQSMTQYVDVQFDFDVPVIANAQAATWFAFLMSAIQRIPFDIYPDATKTNYITCLLMDNGAGLPWRSPGYFELKTMHLRVLITEQQT